MNRKYFAELDGVRALAVLLVFTVHLSPDFWQKMNGGTGVTIFFALSGWLITTLALREESSFGRLDLPAFYVRRVFRIAPLYFAVLLVYVALILGAGMQPERRADFLETLPFYVLFFPEYSQMLHAVPFAGAWSLGVEEKFYMVWPALGFILLAGKFKARVAALIAAAGLFAASTFLDATGYILPPYAFIAMGCLAAVLLHEPSHYRKLRVLGHPWVLVASAAVLAFLQFFLRGVTPGGPLYIVFGLVATAVLVGIVTTNSGGVLWLASRPMRFLGRLSYAFYLSHNFAINAVEKVVGFDGVWRVVISFVVSLIASVLLAWVLHVVVERPMIRVGRRVAAYRKVAATRA